MVCGCKCFCCDVGFWFFGEEGVKDGIGNVVVDFVWVFFWNGFGSECVILLCYEVFYWEIWLLC